MKTKIFSLLSSILLIVGLAACDNHNYGPEIQARGQLSFDGLAIDVDDSQVVVESRATSVNVAEYIVTVTDNNGEVVIESEYAKLPEVVDLVVGNYTVTVESHEVKDAEFEHPYYKGTSNIKIEANKVTDVGVITCKFASICVSIDYSDAIWPLIGDDFMVRVRLNDEAELTFVPDKTDKSKTKSQRGYFKAVSDTYAHSLIVNPVGSISGESVNNLRQIFNNVMAGEHHIVSFKIKNPVPQPEQEGSVDPADQISIDHQVSDFNIDHNLDAEEPNLGTNDRPGQETPGETGDNENPNDKKISITSASKDLDVDNINNVVGVQQNDGHEYKVNIKSEAPLTHIRVKIISNSLTDEMLKEVGLAAEFDLAEPKELKETLGTTFGFPVEDQIIGQYEIPFDITPFVPLLNIYSGELHQFELTVEAKDGDKEIKEVKALKFQS